LQICGNMCPQTTKFMHAFYMHQLYNLNAKHLFGVLLFTILLFYLCCHLLFVFLWWYACLDFFLDLLTKCRAIEVDLLSNESIELLVWCLLFFLLTVIFAVLRYKFFVKAEDGEAVVNVVFFKMSLQIWLVSLLTCLSMSSWRVVIWSLQIFQWCLEEVMLSMWRCLIFYSPERP
jgi:hypothetical protein